MAKRVRVRSATYILRPVGVIRSALKSRKNAPRQGSEGAPDAWLDVRPWASEGLHRLVREDEGLLTPRGAHRARRQERPRIPVSGRSCAI